MKSNNSKSFIKTVKAIIKTKRTLLELDADQLSDIRDDDGTSALMYVIHTGNLYRVPSGATVEQLQADKLPNGVSALFLAAQGGWLHQIGEYFTAAQLAAEQPADHVSALTCAALNGELYLLHGGVTADELAATDDDNGYSGLHGAAAGRCLDQVKGGVGLQQMVSVQDLDGITPLYWAARNGSLNQIRGGVSGEQMRSTLCNGKLSAFVVALAHNNHDQISSGNSEGLACRRLSDEDAFEAARTCCQSADEMLGHGDEKSGQQMMLKVAIDLSWNGHACMVLAHHHINQGNSREAMKFAVRATQMLPEKADAWAILGQIYFDLNQYASACQADERAIQLDPAFAGMNFLVGLVKEYFGAPPQEVEACGRKAIESEPENPIIRKWFADYLKSIGKDKEARAARKEYHKLMEQRKNRTTKEAACIQ